MKNIKNITSKIFNYELVIQDIEIPIFKIATFSFLVCFIVYISVFTIVSTVEINSSTAKKVLVTEAIEKAYFEGQRDYMNGDIRIEKASLSDGSNTYKWIKSPWNNGNKSIFQP